MANLKRKPREGLEIVIVDVDEILWGADFFNNGDRSRIMKELPVAWDMYEIYCNDGDWIHGLTVDTEEIKLGTRPLVYVDGEWVTGEWM